MQHLDSKANCPSNSDGGGDEVAPHHPALETEHLTLYFREQSSAVGIVGREKLVVLEKTQMTPSHSLDRWPFHSSFFNSDK